jgi:predicted ATP-dependent Lon-type protease
VPPHSSPPGDPGGPVHARSGHALTTIAKHNMWTTSELREIARVLKADGRLVVAYRSDSAAPREFPESVYRFRDDDEVRRALVVAELGGVDLIARTLGRSRMSFLVARREGGLARCPARPSGDE